MAWSGVSMMVYITLHSVSIRLIPRVSVFYLGITTWMFHPNFRGISLVLHIYWTMTLRCKHLPSLCQGRERVGGVPLPDRPRGATSWSVPHGDGHGHVPCGGGGVGPLPPPPPLMGHHHWYLCGQRGWPMVFQGSKFPPDGIGYHRTWWPYPCWPGKVWSPWKTDGGTDVLVLSMTRRGHCIQLTVQEMIISLILPSLNAIGSPLGGTSRKLFWGPLPRSNSEGGWSRCDLSEQCH